MNILYTHTSRSSDINYDGHFTDFDFLQKKQFSTKFESRSGNNLQRSYYSLLDTQMTSRFLQGP